MQKVLVNSISSLSYHLPNNSIPQNPHHILSTLHSQNDIHCIDWSEDNIIAFCTTEGIYMGNRLMDSTVEQLRENLEKQIFIDEESKIQSLEERLRQEEREIITTGPENLQESPPKRPLSSRLRKLLIASTNALATNPHYANCFMNEINTPSPNSNANNSNPSNNPNAGSNSLSSANANNLAGSSMNSSQNPVRAPCSTKKLKDSENSFKSNISALSQVIFLFSPSLPGEHSMLVTSHRSRIRYLSFSPASMGPLLLSVDEADSVCMWSMKNHCTNEWFCLHSFSITQVISTFWIPLCKYSMPEVGDEDFINKFGRNGIPMRHKVPAFFTISTSGLVKLIYKRAFEDRWSSLTFKLKKTVEKICHCDMTFVLDKQTNQMKAILAVIGHNPHRIYFFELSFNFGPVKNPSLQCTMKSQIGFPPSSSSTFVTHLKFEKTAPANTPPSSPNLQTHVPAILLVTSNGENSWVSRWEYKETPSQLDRIFNASPDSGIQFRWQQTANITKPNISSFSVFNNGEFVVSYLNSTIEILRSPSLTSVSFINDALSSSQSKKAKLSEDLMFNDSPKETNYAISIVPSPNQSCFSVLDSKNDVHIYLRETSLPNSSDPSRSLADMFELSLLQCSVYWDLLILAREQSIKNYPQFLGLVCWNLLRDLSSMDAATHQYYYPLFQSLLASLLRLKNQQIGYIDCQIRLYIEFLLDMITSSLPRVTQKDLQFDAQILVDKTIEPKLFSYTDWILDFTIFFANNINKYLFAPEDPSPLPKLSQTSELQSFFITNESVFPSLVPCLSLLYDEKFMKDYLSLLVYCNAIRKSFDINRMAPEKRYSTANIKKMYTEIEKLSSNVLKSKRETEEQYTQEYFVESKKNMLSKLSSLFISNFRAVDANEYETLFHKLELFPPLINFIDQNPLTNTRKRKTETYYSYKVIQNVDSKYDVITRSLLTSEDRLLCRQCTGCNRLSKLQMLSEDIDLWQRWEFACPICFGKWKILRNVK